MKEVCDEMYSRKFFGWQLGSGSGHTTMFKMMNTLEVVRLALPCLRDVSTDGHSMCACGESKFHLERMTLGLFFPNSFCVLSRVYPLL